MTDPDFTVRPERREDIKLLKELAERAFGPGRFARTAHRVREAATAVEALSLTSWVGSEFAGSIRFTAIRVGMNSGALLLGPLMVDEKWVGRGCGRVLIEHGLHLAKSQGYVLVLLVGDLPYYKRFGFKQVPPGKSCCQDRWMLHACWPWN